MSNIIKELKKYFTDVYVEPNYTTEEWIVEVSYFEYLAEVVVPAGKLKVESLLADLRQAIEARELEERAAPAAKPLRCCGEQYCFEF